MSTPPVTWHELLGGMRSYWSKNRHLRLGQAYFIYLESVYPDLSELVRGSSADPFYADEMNDVRMERFFDVIQPYFL